MRLNLLLTIFLTPACASSPQERTKKAAVIQKTAVDGIGKSYLTYCRIVRKPACVAADQAAADAGSPQTKDQRIACLRPCDSATAEKIQEGVDVVRTAQTVLFELISSNASDAELAASRAQLHRAVAQLTLLIQQTGVMDLLDEAVEGLNGSDHETTR